MPLSSSLSLIMLGVGAILTACCWLRLFLLPKITSAILNIVNQPLKHKGPILVHCYASGSFLTSNELDVHDRPLRLATSLVLP